MWAARNIACWRGGRLRKTCDSVSILRRAARIRSGCQFILDFEHLICFVFVEVAPLATERYKSPITVHNQDTFLIKNLLQMKDEEHGVPRWKKRLADDSLERFPRW
jgi:hypothetical protein